MKKNPMRGVGLILLGAGLVVLAYGAYQYYEAAHSLGGKISSLFKKLSKDQIRACYQMAAGGAAVVLGFFVSALGRRA